MDSGYLVDRSTLEFLKNLYLRERKDHPNCQIGFGWGGDTTGRRGVNCGIYHDTSQRIPPIYDYEDIPLHFAFPDNMPEELKSGVVCYRDSEFKILPVKEFDPADLVEGVLRDPG